MILHNAKVYKDKGSYAEAVQVQGNRITAVGSNEDVLALAGPQEECIDCQGRVLIPGFNDSHLHCMQFGETRHQAPIEGVRSIGEMIEICKAYTREHPEVAKRGLHAIGWNQDLFRGSGEEARRIPDRHDLDQISTEYPIVLERVCGHVLSTNTRVIELLGLTKDSPQYPGGEFMLDPDGTPNGIFKENACNAASGVIPDYTMQEQRAMLEDTFEYLASLGITSVQSNDVGTTFMDREAAFAMFRDIYREGKGKVRYRHQVCFNDLQLFREFLREREEDIRNQVYPEDGLLTIGPLKLFKDGSLGGRTAYMKTPYLNDEGNIGIEWISVEDMDAYVALAREHQMQVVTHVIGSRAVEETINAYEKGFIDGENKLRHALVHCQITDAELLDRIADKGILVAAQPVFIDADRHIVEALCGEELASTSYAFGTLLRRGVHLSYGTDCPVELPDPYRNIYCAVTRKGLDGMGDEAYNQKECVDVETAIDAYTLESAYMEFAEDRKGRIREGYLADLAILDKDIFLCDPEEIPAIRPVLTMVDGKIVYRK